uniref:Uncharacterized protein n=1 Tax=Clytia hemisphaerica TaxID=252671 RepID=A0A7M5XMZ5_9CNID
MPQELPTCHAFLVYLDNKLTKNGREQLYERKLSEFEQTYITSHRIATPVDGIDQINGAEGTTMFEKLTNKLEKVDAVFIMISENFAAFMNDEPSNGETLPSILQNEYKATYDAFLNFFNRQVALKDPKLMLVYTVKPDNKIPGCLQGFKSEYIIKISTNDPTVGFNEVKSHLEAKSCSK